MSALGAAIAIIQAGQVLLTRREDFEVWCLPGGHVDDGESVAQAAVREAREEVGLVVELTRLVGIYSRPRWLGGSMHVILFAARPVGGVLRPQPAEVLDAGYFSPRALPEPLLVGHRRQILDALHGVGGSIACINAIAWPLAPDMTRQELYDLRDQSGLSRQEFYFQSLVRAGSDDYVVEVDGRRDETVPAQWYHTPE
jgi:ADP-ribose pyrophosphatase YjhB (NUDIX family)